MNESKVLIYFHEAWRKAIILKRNAGQVVLRIEGTSLQLADTEDNLRNGPLQMKESPNFRAILVEVFQKAGSAQGGFYGYGRAWLGKTPIHGIDVRVDAAGRLVPSFQPMFYREAISVLGLSDEQITFMMDRIAEEMASSVRELAAKNYPATVPA